MKHFIVLILTVGLISCNQEKIKEEKHAVNPVKKVSQKMYAGRPDLPLNENEITSIGIGKVILADSINTINNVYDSIIPMMVYRDGLEWSAKKIFLADNEWIFVESINSVNQITSIRTNSKKFRTKLGHSVGITIDSALALQDSIVIDGDRKSFLLYNSGVGFKIDETNEKKFFKLKTKDLSFIKKANISELFIRCEDC